MNYCYFTMLLFLLFGISNAQIPEDKLKHIGAGVVIGGASGFAANQFLTGINVGPGRPPYVAVLPQVQQKRFMTFPKAESGIMATYFIPLLAGLFQAWFSNSLWIKVNVGEAAYPANTKHYKLMKYKKIPLIDRLLCVFRKTFQVV